jgi:UDP-N-acetylglucosamine enolpyruvyl transferase
MDFSVKESEFSQHQFSKMFAKVVEQNYAIHIQMMWEQPKISTSLHPELPSDTHNQLISTECN